MPKILALQICLISHLFTLVSCVRRDISTFNHHPFFSNYCSSNNDTNESSTLLQLLEVAYYPSVQLNIEPSDNRKEILCNKIFYAAFASLSPSSADPPYVQVTFI